MMSNRFRFQSFHHRLNPPRLDDVSNTLLVFYAPQGQCLKDSSCNEYGNFLGITVITKNCLQLTPTVMVKIFRSIR